MVARWRRHYLTRQLGKARSLHASHPAVLTPSSRCHHAVITPSRSVIQPRIDGTTSPPERGRRRGGGRVGWDEDERERERHDDEPHAEYREGRVPLTAALLVEEGDVTAPCRLESHTLHTLRLQIGGGRGGWGGVWRVVGWRVWRVAGTVEVAGCQAHSVGGWGGGHPHPPWQDVGDVTYVTYSRMLHTQRMLRTSHDVASHLVGCRRRSSSPLRPPPRGLV